MRAERRAELVSPTACEPAAGKIIARPSKRRRQPSALSDGPPGVQFSGYVGAANQMYAAAGAYQFLVEVAQGFLAGAQHHGVNRERAFSVRYSDMQSTVVYTAPASQPNA